MGLFISGCLICNFNADPLTIFGLILGIVFTIFSIVILIKQSTDYICVENGQLTFRNSLRKKSFSTSNKIKVTFEEIQEYVKLTSQAGSGSTFNVVELFIIYEGSKYRILDFQMNAYTMDKAKKLGNELSALINAYLQVNTVNKSSLEN